MDGMGTFAAGENVGGSVFMGGPLSADWIPKRKTSFSLGLESGLPGGETQGNIIFGVPAIFRLGWHPGITKNVKIDIFILLKTGWAFGIWGYHLNLASISPIGVQRPPTSPDVVRLRRTKSEAFFDRRS